MTEPQHHKLEGLVVDKNNSPIATIWVRAYRGLDEVGDHITLENGKYELEFAPGSPISTIRYDHLVPEHFKRRHPTVVTNVSGSSNHCINKVMPDRVGLGYDQHELLEMLSAYELLYVIDKASAREGIRRGIRDRYKENLYMLKYVDSITAQRIQQVLELYEQTE